MKTMYVHKIIFSTLYIETNLSAPINLHPEYIYRVQIIFSCKYRHVDFEQSDKCLANMNQTRINM